MSFFVVVLSLSRYSSSPVTRHARRLMIRSRGARGAFLLPLTFVPRLVLADERRSFGTRARISFFPPRRCLILVVVSFSLERVRTVDSSQLSIPKRVASFDRSNVVLLFLFIPPFRHTVHVLFAIRVRWLDF